MSWENYADRELAERVLTPRQLEALRLHVKGYGFPRIGRIMWITAQAAHGHVVRAQLKIDKAKKGEAA